MRLTLKKLVNLEKLPVTGYKLRISSFAPNQKDYMSIAKSFLYKNDPGFELVDAHQCDQIWQKFITLAKLKSYKQFFQNILEPTLAIFKAIGLIFIVVNGQILYK